MGFVMMNVKNEDNIAHQNGNITIPEFDRLASISFNERLKEANLGYKLALKLSYNMLAKLGKNGKIINV